MFMSFLVTPSLSIWYDGLKSTYPHFEFIPYVRVTFVKTTFVIAYATKSSDPCQNSCTTCNSKGASQRNVALAEGSGILVCLLLLKWSFGFGLGLKMLNFECLYKILMLLVH